MVLGEANEGLAEIRILQQVGCLAESRTVGEGWSGQRAERLPLATRPFNQRLRCSVTCCRSVAAPGNPPPPLFRSFMHASFAAPQDPRVGVVRRRRQGDTPDPVPLLDAGNSDALTSRRDGRFKREDEQCDKRGGRDLK